ncbi:MAG: tRNA1(Val) (adenine(37)-N6)-methyltransferase [Clostridia bacterium]|nr:tRNA1(Val) (adenine(37)-N6)-methyltransferase [Clostridia bacterium]
MSDLRLDDLQCNGLKIMQYPDGYCFTSDAVLLANTVRCKSGDTIVDFGCGNGVISLLLTAKTPCEKVIGIELQKDVTELAIKNVGLNNLQDKITILNGDIADAPDILGKESVQVVVCNPPYFSSASGEKRESPQIALSRHESSCNLEGIIQSASKILKFGGAFYIIHKTSRMAEVITYCSQYKLIPKTLTLIYPKISKKADTFVLTCKKCGKHSLSVEKLVVYNEDGSMTEEAKAMYNKLYEQ